MLNASGRLATDRNFEVDGTRSGEGRVYAVGMLAQGGYLAPVDSFWRVFDTFTALFGGLQTTRWIHHIVMWLLWGFAAHHVWSAVLMSTEEANATIESIFSGHKFVLPEDLVYSGYRFKKREEIPEEFFAAVAAVLAYVYRLEEAAA